MLFPFTYSSWGYAETEPNSIDSAGTPPSVKYFVTEAVAFSTFRTESEIVGATCSALRVHTALSAETLMRAEPVTDIPSVERAANPLPT